MASPQSLTEEQVAEEEILEAFRAFDVNNKGFVSAAELERITRPLQTRLTDDDFDEMVREAEAASGNVIDYQAFAELMVAVPATGSALNAHDCHTRSENVESGMFTTCDVCSQLMSGDCLWLPLRDIQHEADRCLRCRALCDIVGERPESVWMDYLLKVTPIPDRLMYVDLYTWASRAEQLKRLHSIHVFKTRAEDTIRFFSTLGVGRAVAKTGGDESCVAFVKDALHECASHPGCGPQSDVPLPKRLIKIEGSRVFLAETEGRVGKYTALSYCWGEPGQVLKTTNATLKRHLQELPWGELPRTIKEAIMFTKSLGLQYIWIDVFCIVQPSEDDDTDWKIEASKMASYYSNALVTIGASRAGSIADGMYGSRQGWSAPRVLEITDGDRQRKKILAQEQPCDLLEEFGRMHKLGPISERGWTFQENALASRMVHFTGPTLLWECKSHLIAETGHPILPVANAVAEPMGLIQQLQSCTSGVDGHDTWSNYVLWFTERTLKYNTDRLAAIAGIASWLREHRPGYFQHYRAGLWDEEVAHDLSWYLHERKPAEAVKSNFPTWSWISVDKAVGFLFPPGSGAAGETLCFLEDEGQPSDVGPGMDLVSVLQPVLHIRALTRHGRLQLTDDLPRDEEKWHHYKISLDGLADRKGGSYKQNTGVSLTFFPDSHLAPVGISGPNGSAMTSIRRANRSSPFNVEITVAWCGRHADSDSSSRTYKGIVLALRGGGRYSRVGFLMAAIPLDKDDWSFHTQQSLLVI